MSDEELQTIWRQSIDHYGGQMQSIVCMEECAELIQAISKKLRDPTSPNDHLAEEMADVIICLHQLKLMYGITDKENREQAIHEIKHKGWVEGAHGIQAGHLYCPSHAKDIWEES